MTPCTLFITLQAAPVLGLMLFSSGLLGRPFCFRRQITVREARMTQISDLLLWLGAGVIALSQSSLWLWDPEANSRFDLANAFQLVQIGLFVAILGLDIWPSRKFRSWSRCLDLDQVPYFTDREHVVIRRLWRLQATCLILIPLCTPLIQMGIGRF